MLQVGLGSARGARACRHRHTAETLPALIGELGKKGTRAAVVITAGFSPALKQAMLDQARPYCLRIIGPNCLGISVPELGLSANFGLNHPKVGKLAFLSQSGALMTGILDWAAVPRHRLFLRGVHGRHDGCGRGRPARLPRRRRLDELDPALSRDDPRRAQVHVGGALRRAGEAGDRYQVGAQQQSARAAATHTGALAGSDAAVSAAFRRAGLVRVGELEELFAAAETLAT